VQVPEPDLEDVLSDWEDDDEKREWKVAERARRLKERVGGQRLDGHAVLLHALQCVVSGVWWCDRACSDTWRSLRVLHQEDKIATIRREREAKKAAQRKAAAEEQERAAKAAAEAKAKAKPADDDEDDESDEESDGSDGICVFARVVLRYSGSLMRSLIPLLADEDEKKTSSKVVTKKAGKVAADKGGGGLRDHSVC